MKLSLVIPARNEAGNIGETVAALRRCLSDASIDYYTDVTNAFKGYRRNVVDGCRPLLSPHFNLTVELPLKAIVRGFTYAVVPISWPRGDYRRLVRLGVPHGSRARRAGTEGGQAACTTSQ